MTEETKPDFHLLLKQKRFIIGIILVIASFILGFFGKGIIAINITEPIAIIKGVSIWVFSWILLLIGVFLVGRATLKIIRKKIKDEVEQTVKKSYEITKEQAQKGIKYTKELHKKTFKKQLKKQA